MKKIEEQTNFCINCTYFSELGYEENDNWCNLDNCYVAILDICDDFEKKLYVRELDI